eukprot:CAMPEP_0177431316 /NCGR_PEP_ID=MMETSP0368-20130122/76124_1 /TAXON_ID=447022 ORGANISM="Scrippsiella hangoei-like, Strain SHHI-4" /NCGR_SAMPLE_ID=MMETSP0368 /ASSEMBLY_ACC=CAM_ASM_000363 /LENGTH=74 /DNA_ID=CAMNT_0018901967 /DNA_START=234 /DNA_END=458 /DNA_ORIENTATION=+
MCKNAKMVACRYSGAYTRHVLLKQDAAAGVRIIHCSRTLAQSFATESLPSHAPSGTFQRLECLSSWNGMETSGK